MIKRFEIEETIQLRHTIEVEIDEDKEEDFENFCENIADEYDRTDDKYSIIQDFRDEFGSDSVTFIEDGSGDVELEFY